MKWGDFLEKEKLVEIQKAVREVISKEQAEHVEGQTDLEMLMLSVDQVLVEVIEGRDAVAVAPAGSAVTSLEEAGEKSAPPPAPVVRGRILPGRKLEHNRRKV